jgi:excisionase family DNA binding protein
MTDRLLTVHESALYLQTSDWFVRQEAKVGRLRVTRVGRLLRFREEWLDAYAERNATGGSDETVWGGFRVQEGRREVGRPVGDALGERPSSKGLPRPRKRGGSVAGDPRGTGLELAVAPLDRKRRRVPRSVAG